MLRIATLEMEALGAKVGQSLGGLVSVGIPFGAKISIGTRKTAQAVARAGDAVGDYLRFGNPVGRALGSLFDHNVGGAVDAITQRGWERYGQPTLEALKATGRDDSCKVLE